MHYATQGIVLARRSFSEADRLVTLFSRDFGKVTLLAKGVKKPKSRKRGHIEVFNWVKFSARRSRSIDLLLEVSSINSFSEIRQDLKKVAVAYFLLEAINRTTRESEQNEDLYQLLLRTLRRLTKEQHLRSLREDFIYELLVFGGFWAKGTPMENPDKALENIIERKVTSVRVGKRLLS